VAKRTHSCIYRERSGAGGLGGWRERERERERGRERERRREKEGEREREGERKREGERERERESGSDGLLECDI